MSTLLKKLGEALHISHDKKLVIKLSFVPPLYITVYDYAMKRVGVLYDVIGPVKSPFGLIKPEKNILENPNQIIGKPVYVRVLDLERARGKGRRK
jgi:RNA-binding protein